MLFSDTQGFADFRCQGDKHLTVRHCWRRCEKKFGFRNPCHVHGSVDRVCVPERLAPPDDGGRRIALASLPPYRKRARRDRFRWVREHVEITRKHHWNIDIIKEDQ